MLRVTLCRNPSAHVALIAAETAQKRPISALDVRETGIHHMARAAVKTMRVAWSPPLTQRIEVDTAGHTASDRRCATNRAARTLP
eukprot:6186157-Pleurochrysis_carterae.AAC.5